MDAIVALDAARNAILFHESEAHMLAGPYVGSFQVSLYHEVFYQINHQGLRDYNLFAAKYFVDCNQHLSTPSAYNLEQVASCFAKLEIPMDLRVFMLLGQSESEANDSVKNRLTSRVIYPAALIDKITPQIYNAPSESAFFELRQSVFESCIRS